MARIWAKGTSEEAGVSVEPIELQYIENPRGSRNLQHFMKDAKWDEEGAEKFIKRIFLIVFRMMKE